MKDFNEMSLEELKGYVGPVFRASVSALVYGADGKLVRVSHDYNSTSIENLNRKIRETPGMSRRVEYGPHSDHVAFIQPRVARK